MGSKRPQVSLLERKETYSMTSDVSKQIRGQTGCNCQFCNHKLFNLCKSRSVKFHPSVLFMNNCIQFCIIIFCQFIICYLSVIMRYLACCFVFIVNHSALLSQIPSFFCSFHSLLFCSSDYSIFDYSVLLLS